MRGGWTLHAPMFAQTPPRPLQLGNVTLQTAPLEPADVLHQLLVVHQRSLEPFVTEAGSFAAFPMPDDGVFVLCYFCDNDCLSFVFDAWSETTRGHLVRARDHSGIVIALLSPGGPTFVGGGTARFWTNALDILHSCRSGATPRGPHDYVQTLDKVDFTTRHLRALRAAVRRDEGLTRPLSVMLMLERSHARAFFGSNG